MYHRPSFGAFPPIIKNLLIINGLVFLAQLVFPNVLERFFGLWPLFVNFDYWQLVSYGFLHGNLMHLFFIKRLAIFIKIIQLTGYD